ncbi:MAG: AsmA family protein [Candidatus Omnitrophica bacterium]|nr:AsmA family protein [Candidatus Omnitrophota bacterium]
MKRWIVLSLLLLVALAGIGLLGLEIVNRRILPAKVREWATELSLATGRSITIGRVRLHPWHGLLMEEVSVGEDPRYGKIPFLQIHQVSGRVLYLPLLRRGQIVVPTLWIVRPQARLLQDTEGLWNFESIHPTISASPQKHPSPSQLLVPRIVIAGGTLELSLQKSPLQRPLRWENVDLEAHLALPARIDGTLSARLALEEAPPRAPAQRLALKQPIPFELRGAYDFQGGNLDLAAQSQVPLPALLELLPPSLASSFSSLEGTAALELGCAVKSKGPLSLRGSLKMENLLSKYRMRGGGLFQVDGNLEIKAETQAPSFSWGKLLSGFGATCQLQGVQLSPLPAVGGLREIRGMLSINSQGIRTEGLTASIPTGQPVSIAGTLSNDKEKSFALQVKTRLPLQSVSDFSPKLHELSKGVKLSGETALEAKLTGHLLPGFSLEPAITAAVQKASVEFPGGESLRDLEGTLRWQTDWLSVTRLTGLLRDKPFHLEGTLVNFTEPEIDARLSWDRLSAEARFSIDGNRAEIGVVSGRYGSGTFRVFGEIEDLKETRGNLYGETTLEMGELKTLLPAPPTWLQTANFSGSLAARWILKGDLQRPSGWDFSLKANSPRLEAAGLPLTELSLDLHLQEGRWNLSSGRAELAEGSVLLSGLWDLQNSSQPWQAALRLQEIQLSALATLLNWKTRDLSGGFFLTWEGTGEGTDLSRIRGEGLLEIQGAKILELPFLGELGQLLRLPSLRSIVFEAARGPFAVSEGNLKTESFQLKAPQATLTVMGRGGFLQGAESPIQWKILPTLSPELLPEESRSRLGKVIAQGTSYLVGEVRVTGTWKNPKTTFVSKPLTQILNEQLLNLQDLLKDLL